MTGVPPTTMATDVGAAARRDLAALCARLFATEVDAALYRRLAAVEAAGDLPPGFAPADAGSTDEGAALEDMAVEFCRLFLGPNPACPPYESMYRNSALLGGRTVQRLRDFMDRHAVHVGLPEGYPIASLDHISVELTLLAHLLDRVDGAPQESRRAALAAVRELLDEHLLAWVPEYLKALEASAPRRPYAALGRLTAALLAEEQAAGGLLPDAAL